MAVTGWSLLKNCCVCCVGRGVASQELELSAVVMANPETGEGFEGDDGLRQRIMDPSRRVLVLLFPPTESALRLVLENAFVCQAKRIQRH